VARKQSVDSSLSLADRLKSWGSDPFDGVRFWLPTKQTPLDCAISGGKGIPGGRAIMIRGPENAGKDIVASLIGASAQEQGGRVVWFKGEKRIGDGLFSLTGMATDPDSLIVKTPMNLQALMDEFKFLIQSLVNAPAEPIQTPTVCVVNSVASFGIEDLVMWDKNKKGVKEKNQPMSAPAYWDRFFKSEEYKRMADLNFYLILINQLRDNVDFFSYGPKSNNSPGGWAIKHNISVRIEVDRASIGPFLNSTMEKELDPEFEVGYCIHQRISKNDVGPGGRQARSVWFGHHGLDDVLSMFSWLCDKDIIPGVNGYYTIGEERKTYVDWLNTIRGNHQWEYYLRELFKSAYVAKSLYRGKLLLHGSED